jgi:threonine/homoserine/homoserine lactone efflux protein
MGAEGLVKFAIASLAFGFKPGPGMVVHAMRALSDGKKAALTMAVGTETGHALVFLLLWSGLYTASVFGNVFELFLVFLGGGYLVYVGSRSFLSNGDKLNKNVKTTPLSFKELYLSGVVWAFINPVNIAFYLAILPSFFEISELPINYMLYVLPILVVSVFSSHLVFVYFAGSIRDIVGSEKNNSIMNAIGNTVFVGIGLFSIGSGIIKLGFYGG